jgi:hypothetical protein
MLRVISRFSKWMNFQSNLCFYFNPISHCFLCFSMTFIQAIFFIFWRNERFRDQIQVCFVRFSFLMITKHQNCVILCFFMNNPISLNIEFFRFVDPRRTEDKRPLDGKRAAFKKMRDEHVKLTRLTNQIALRSEVPLKATYLSSIVF